jgi:hypothetical protein
MRETQDCNPVQNWLQWTAQVVGLTIILGSLHLPFSFGRWYLFCLWSWWFLSLNAGTKSAKAPDLPEPPAQSCAPNCAKMLPSVLKLPRELSPLTWDCHCPCPILDHKLLMYTWSLGPWTKPLLPHVPPGCHCQEQVLPRWLAQGRGCRGPMHTVVTGNFMWPNSGLCGKRLSPVFSP